MNQSYQKKLKNNLNTFLDSAQLHLLDLNPTNRYSFPPSPQLQARKTVHEKELKAPTQDSILMKIHWNDLADIKHPRLINTIANLVKM